MEVRVAVIGGGISGLTTANLLKEKCYKVIVYEKERKPGGLVRCERIAGSLFHICGGHVFNSKRQDVLEWFWKTFSQERDFFKAERNSVIFMDDSLVIPSPIENHMYLFDKDIQKRFIEDLLSISQNDNCHPDNFDEFLRYRFGKTLYEIYFRPYNEKIWNRDLSKIPLSWLDGQLPMPSVAEMIFNNMNHVNEKSFVHSMFWYEKKDGSQFIVYQLAKDIDIYYNNEIKKVSLRGEKWIVNGQEFDKIVFCGNIKDMVRLIEGVDVNSYKRYVEELQYHGTTAVFCEIDKTPYSWIYMPSKHHKSHRIICTGNFASSNNGAEIPRNRITATVEFTDEISKNYILQYLAYIPLHPRYIDHHYTQYAYPIQDKDTKNMIKSLKEYLAKFGFYFTGRFADWEYYNMDVSMGAAMDLTSKI